MVLVEIRKFLDSMHCRFNLDSGLRHTKGIFGDYLNGTSINELCNREDDSYRRCSSIIK